MCGYMRCSAALTETLCGDELTVVRDPDQDPKVHNLVRRLVNSAAITKYCAAHPVFCAAMVVRVCGVTF